MEDIFERNGSARPTVLWANLCYLMSAVMQQPVAYLVVWLFSMFVPNAEIGTISSAASAAYQILILGLLGVWYAVRQRETLPSMRLNPPHFGLMLGAAALGFSGVLLANNLGTWWMLLLDRLGIPLQESAVEIPKNSQELMRGILLIGVLPGVCEELFFRGMMLSAWERRGTKTALIVSAVLFALLHGSIMGFPVQLLMGFVLGYLLLVSNSLYTGMTYHTVYNSATLILAYLSAQGGAADSAVYEHLTEYVEQTIGYMPLLQSTLMTIGFFVFVLILMQKGLPKIEWKPSEENRRLNRRELLTLIAALFSVAFLWSMNF